MAKNEVEREVLAFVLITIILVSFLGTWVILNVIDQKQQVKYVDHYRAGSQVSLLILPPSQQQLPSNQGDGNED